MSTSINIIRIVKSSGPEKSDRRSSRMRFARVQTRPPARHHVLLKSRRRVPFDQCLGCSPSVSLFIPRSGELTQFEQIVSLVGISVISAFHRPERRSWLITCPLLTKLTGLGRSRPRKSVSRCETEKMSCVVVFSSMAFVCCSRILVSQRRHEIDYVAPVHPTIDDPQALPRQIC